MVKKTAYLVFFWALILWSCATYQPPPPSFYLDDLPPSFVAGLSLDERILTEEIWKNLRQGSVNQAAKLLAKLGTENPLYLPGLGYAHYLLKDLVAAEQAFKSAAAEHPEIVLSYLGLAQIYQETGGEDEAFTAFREVLKREPDHPWAKTRYESLRARKTDESLREAKSLLASGNREQSKAAYLKTLYYSPRSTEAHLALADIYRSENMPQNALVHLKAASSTDPENREILKRYGEILLQMEDYKTSLNIYERLAEMDADNPQVKERLETIKNRLGIVELPSQYDQIPYSSSITREETASLIAVKFKDTLEDPKAKTQILVDISTSWASKYILKITSLGLLDVFPNHTFQPKKTVSRAEMAEVLSRLISHLEKKGFRFIPQIPAERIQVADVSQENYYYQPILHVLTCDIMTLYPDKTFKPDLQLSGKEAVKLLDLVLALIK